MRASTAFSASVLHTTALCATLVGLPLAAYAGPENGVVTGGSAVIETTGPNTTINQSSDRAIIRWDSFDLNSSESVRFNQPSAGSITVNRIRDAKPSQIDGRISANGNIILINPNGVVFGASSVVDVGGVVATSSDLDNDNDFLNGGAVKFTKPGHHDAKIVNNGTMTVGDAGLAGLVAPHVENNGVIRARMGKVHLASGDIHTVDFAGDGLIKLEASSAVMSQSVRNTGAIEADGGDVYLSAAQARGVVDALVFNSSTIRADSVTLADGGIKRGSVTLNTRDLNEPARQGRGEIVQSGAILARGLDNAGQGGIVHIFADLITIADDALIDVSGGANGGTILIGGDFQGGNGLPTSDDVFVSNRAILNAESRRRGNGGRIILWSDDITSFKGFADVSGGADGGAGGFIEVSSKNRLDYAGSVDLSSVGGVDGSLLLDPTDIVISSGANANMSGGPNFSSTIDDAPSVLNVATLLSALASGNVIVQTRATGSQAGNITVDSALSWGSGHTLTLDAHNNITVNQAINGGGLTMIAGGDVALNANIAGTGTLAIRQANTSQSMGLGNSAVGTLNLTTTEIGRIVDGWNSIVLGRTDSTSAIDVRALTWNDNLTLQSGTGTMTFNGNQTMNANNLTIITDGDIALNNNLAGTGTLTIAQSSAGTAMGLGNSQTGTVNLTTTEIGRITNGWASLVFGRADGTGAVNVGALTWNDNLTVQSGSGQMNINAVQTMGANNLSLITDSNLVITTANALFSSGTLIIAQASASASIGLGDGEAGDLNLSTAEIARIRNGWTNIIIGRTDGTGAVNVGALTWNDNLTLQSGSGQMNINGVQTMAANNLTLRTDSNVAVNAALTGTGAFTLVQSGAAASMGLGSGETGTVHMDDTELNNLTNGWVSLTFGRADSAGDMNVGARTWNDVLTLQTGSGRIAMNGTQTMGANNLTIRTDADPAINGALTGTGTFALVQSGIGTSMGLGTGESGDVSLDNIELGNITNGWTSLVFGRTDGTGAMNVGARSWVDPLTLRTASGLISVNGTQSMAANALTITTNSDLALNAALTGTGTLSIGGTAAGVTMGVGTGQTGDLVLDDTELSRLTNGWTSIILGSASSTGDLNVGATTWVDPLTLRTGAGILRINGAVNVGANNIALYANSDIAINANIVGTAAMTLSGSATTTTIGIGDGQTGVYHLSNAELSRIIDGYSTIVIGSTSHTAAINVGAWTWNDALSLRNSTGILTINGAQDMGANALTIQANSNPVINANLIGTGTLSLLGSSNGTSIGIGTGQAGAFHLDDTELGRIADGWGTIIIGGTSVTGALNVGARTWLDSVDFRTAGGALNINGAQNMGANNLTIRTNSNLQINDALTGTGTLTIIPTTASVSMGLGDGQAGTLALTNAELNRITDGWANIIFGTTSMTGAMNVGARVWNDNLTLRMSTGAMNINGAQTMGNNSLTLTTGSNLLIGGALSGTGTLTISQASATVTMGIGDGQAGTLALSDAELNFLSNGWASIVLGSTGSTVAMNVGARTWNDNLTLCTSTGVITIAGAQNMGANDLTFISSGNSVINAALTGTGALAFRATAANVTMGVGTGQGGTINFTDTELGRFTNGWSNIVFGRADSTATMAAGVYAWNDNVTYITGSGVLTIAGAQNMGANDLTIQAASNLVLNAALTGTGTLTIQGSTIGTAMGVGTGQAGTLLLDNTELSRLTNGWTAIQFGRTDSTSAMNIGAYTWQDRVRFVNGGNIVLNGDQVSAETAGTNLVFATVNGAFVNNAGSDAIDAGAGRYLVYAVDENNDTLGGLIRPTVVTNKTYAGYGPGSVVESGDVYIYSGVVAKVILVEIDDATKEYGGNLPTFTYTYIGGLQNGDLLSDAILTYNLTAAGSSALDDAGTTRVINGSFGTGLGYSVTIVSTGTLTVTKAMLTVTGDDDSRVYGDANPALGLTYSGFRNGDDMSDIDTLANASTTAILTSNVGGYAITGAGAIDDNYDFIYVDGTLNVTKATLTATAQNTSRVYGDANPAFTFNYTGFKNGENAGVIDTGATGASAATALSNVNTYAITGSGALDNNYTFNYVNGTLTVTKAMLTVTANNAGRDYGDANPALSVSYSGFKNGEASNVIDTQATASTVANALSNVNTYAITAAGAADNNYNFTYANGTLTVNKATLTATANDAGREYGDANPALSVSYAGFKNGQNAGVIDSGVVASTTATNTTGAGTHTITASGGLDDNYTFAYVNGTLTIAKATLTATADNASRVYGDANPALGVTYTGFKNSENAGVINTGATASTTATSLSGVNTYAITASGASDDNYNFNYVDGTLTVNKATLTATADNASREYGDANPGFTVGYSGFKNGETSAVIDTAATAASGANALSDVNAYAITAAGAADNNYDFVYVDGVLTISKATLSATAGNATREYGDANPGFTVSYSGFKNGQNAGVIDTGATASSSATNTAGAGMHTIVAAGASDNNYTFSYVDGALTITKATLTATAQDESREYGDANPGFTVTYGGFKNGEDSSVIDTLAGAASVGAGANAGTHAIAASGALDDNYVFHYVDGTLTVTKATVTVTANNATRQVGTPNPAFSATYNGFKNGENSAVIDMPANVSTTANLATPVGDYAITASGALDGNYIFVYVDGILSVTADPPPVAQLPPSLPSSAQAALNPQPIDVPTPVRSSAAAQSEVQRDGFVVLNDRAIRSGKMRSKKKFLMAISASLYQQVFGARPVVEDRTQDPRNEREKPRNTYY